MSNFKLPWEEERIKFFIDSFQCKVMDLVPVEEDQHGAQQVGSDQGQNEESI